MHKTPAPLSDSFIFINWVAAPFTKCFKIKYYRYWSRKIFVSISFPPVCFIGYFCVAGFPTEVAHELCLSCPACAPSAQCDEDPALYPWEGERARGCMAFPDSVRKPQEKWHNRTDTVIQWNENRNKDSQQILHPFRCWESGLQMTWGSLMVNFPMALPPCQYTAKPLYGFIMYWKVGKYKHTASISKPWLFSGCWAKEIKHVKKIKPNYH